MRLFRVSCHHTFFFPVTIPPIITYTNNAILVYFIFVIAVFTGREESLVAVDLRAKVASRRALGKIRLQRPLHSMVQPKMTPQIRGRGVCAGQARTSDPGLCVMQAQAGIGALHHSLKL